MKPFSLLVILGTLFCNESFSQQLSTMEVIYDYLPTSATLVAEENKAITPRIESILNNPSITKRQLDRETVQATGFRATAQRHFDIHINKRTLHGDWKSFYDNNQLCDSGRLHRNLPDGEWKTWYPNGSLRTVRSYSAEKFHYIKTDLRRNHPKDHRFAMTTLARKSRSVKHHFEPVHKSDASVDHNLSILEKIEHNTASDGSSYIPPFKDCIHHGLFVNYYDDGLVKDSGHYVNGLRHGVWQEGSAGGKAVGYYDHGIRHGQWKFYDASGRLTYTEHYRHGKSHSTHHFRAHAR